MSSDQRVDADDESWINAVTARQSGKTLSSFRIYTRGAYGAKSTYWLTVGY